MLVDSQLVPGGHGAYPDVCGAGLLRGDAQLLDPVLASSRQAQRHVAGNRASGGRQRMGFTGWAACRSAERRTPEFSSGGQVAAMMRIGVDGRWRL
jgi:hypothetical protein